MDRKTYMKEAYSKYWIDAREKRYGFLEYDKNLCSLICEHIPKGSKLLEVAIGTGYPFADFFQRMEYSLYGIDISPTLIEKVHKLYPSINAKVGDAENIEYPDDFFDCTYCFHSTWYFPDLEKAIGEMIKVTRPGGLIIFDIQNHCNKEIGTAYRKNVKETIGIRRIKRHVKNMVKIILCKCIPDWNFVVYEVPAYPEDICKYLLDSYSNCTFQVFIVKKNKIVEARERHSSFYQYGRLVYILWKSGKR